MKIAGYNVELIDEFEFEAISYQLYKTIGVVDKHIIHLFDLEAEKVYITKIFNNSVIAINEFNETKNILKGK